jgi:hypothetical protein
MKDELWKLEGEVGGRGRRQDEEVEVRYVCLLIIFATGSAGTISPVALLWHTIRICLPPTHSGEMGVQLGLHLGVPAIFLISIQAGGMGSTSLPTYNAASSYT